MFERKLSIPAIPSASGVSLHRKENTTLLLKAVILLWNILLFHIQAVGLLEKTSYT